MSFQGYLKTIKKKQDLLLMILEEKPRKKVSQKMICLKPR